MAGAVAFSRTWANTRTLYYYSHSHACEFPHFTPSSYVYSISKTTTDFVGSVIFKMLPLSSNLLKVAGFTA